MFANLVAKSAERVRTLPRTTRAQRIALGVLCGFGFALAAGYHLLLWSRGEETALSVAILYRIVVLFSAFLLWTLLAQGLQQRHAAPARVFWTTLFWGGLFIGAGRLVLSVGSIPPGAGEAAGFEYGTVIPLLPWVIFRMWMLSVLETAFAFLLLLRLRGLVLFKRTKSSQRNWYSMLALMSAAALLTFLKQPQESFGSNGFEILVMVPVVALMVVNALRLSWIVFLSFREKVACIGLTLLLLLFLMYLGVMDTDLLPPAPNPLPDSYAYLKYFSYPLGIFANLTFLFAILYCTTSFLSLLFHLPTTSDFQQKVGEVAAMHSLTTLVGQVFDFEMLTATIAASPVEAGTAHRSWLAVADLHQGSLRPRVIATHNIPPDRVAALVDTEALYEELYSRREPLVIDQAPADHRVTARPGDGIGSLLVVPLIARTELLGALFITKEVTHGFEQDDVDALAVYAAQAALALDHARLFEEQLDKERLAQELAIAHEVQRKLLPQSLPELNGFTLAASSVSALEVGGDYYDFIEIDAERVAFIIADASGKGTSAAFYMAEMQGIFHSVSRLAPTPAAFLTLANDALATTLEKHAFISVIYGIIDLKKEEVLLARAGHCPAATINLDGEARYLRTNGLGLGLDRGPLFQRALVEETLSLQPGDVFVLYTDGIVESRSANGEEYGYERLLQALRQHRHEDATDLHNALLADLHTFLGHETYDDDMTLVVLKWHGIHLPQATSVSQDLETDAAAAEHNPSTFATRT